MNLSDRIINSISNIPTLPAIFNKLSEALGEEYVSNQKIAGIISSDQSSAFKILKVANSPFFGLSKKIESINQALIFLGHNEVRNIFSTLSIMKHFSNNNQNSALRPIDLWAHSIGVGVIARNLGIVTGQQKIDNYFLAGILHDIGKVIFLEIIPNEYKTVLDYAASKKISIKEAEMEILKMDHSRAGYLLAQKWKMPGFITDVIVYHHSGETPQGTNQMLSTIHLANIIARIMKFGYSGDCQIPQPNIKIWDSLNLGKGDILSLRDKLISDFKHTTQTILLA